MRTWNPVWMSQIDWVCPKSLVFVSSIFLDSVFSSQMVCLLKLRTFCNLLVKYLYSALWNLRNQVSLVQISGPKWFVFLDFQSFEIYGSKAYSMLCAWGNYQGGYNYFFRVRLKGIPNEILCSYTLTLSSLISVGLAYDL